MKDQIEAITKSELKFWIPIVGTIVTVVIMFVKLDARVQAMTEREQVNKTQFEQMSDTVDDIQDTVNEINTNQRIIMRELGIE